MKSFTHSIFTLLCCCTLITSCGDEWRTDCPGLDSSLTGSISYSYGIEAEATLDGEPIENFDSYPQILYFKKLSKTKVSMELGIGRGDDRFMEILIPEIPVSGEPFNVAFDYSSNDGTVSYDTFKDIKTNVSIKGSMKRVTTRCSPAWPMYSCDMIVECMVDGKKLSIKINFADPH